MYKNRMRNKLIVIDSVNGTGRQKLSQKIYYSMRGRVTGLARPFSLASEHSLGFSRLERSSERHGYRSSWSEDSRVQATPEPF